MVWHFVRYPLLYTCFTHTSNFTSSVRSSSSSSSCSWRFRHVYPVPCSSKWSWSLHLFLGRPTFLRPLGLYCSACFGILFVSILCTCCSHFSWYCAFFFTMFCAPVFFPPWCIDSFLYLVLLFPVSVPKISSVLLINVAPLFSSVPRLHFQILMLFNLTLFLCSFVFQNVSLSLR
jgi:hypothetical protein